MLQMAIESSVDRRAVVRSTPERRRGPRPHVPPKIESLRTRSEGRPLRLRDLSALTGWSKAKLLADIRGDYLRATCDPKSGIWMIAWAEGRRYLRALGMLR